MGKVVYNIFLCFFSAAVNCGCEWGGLFRKLRIVQHWQHSEALRERFWSLQWICRKYFRVYRHAQNSERKFFSPIAMLPFSIPATFVSYFVKISSGYYLFPFLFKMFCGVGFISVSAILFSRFLPMGGIERFLFCLIYLFSFCSVLFIFIPEQYTLVVLCISILLTAITHKSAHLPEIFWVTVGTLITNGVLIFLIDSWKPFRERIYSLIRGAVFVLCVSLVFGQAHSFVKIVGHIESTSDKFSKPLCAESVFFIFWNRRRYYRKSR